MARNGINERTSPTKWGAQASATRKLTSPHGRFGRRLGPCSGCLSGRAACRNHPSTTGWGVQRPPEKTPFHPDKIRVTPIIFGVKTIDNLCKGSTRALKPKAKVPRSPKHRYKWPHRKDLCLSKTFKLKDYLLNLFQNLPSSFLSSTWRTTNCSSVSADKRWYIR